MTVSEDGIERSAYSTAYGVGTGDYGKTMVLTSIAISLKRIADLMEKKEGAARKSAEANGDVL